MGNEELIARIRSILSDESIGRYDLLPLFKDLNLLAEIVNVLSTPYIGKIDFVAAPEAIGWLLGIMIAKELNVGFIPIRKGNKLPYPKEHIIKNNYIDYSGNEKSLEINENSIAKGSKVLIVDEWIETGSSIRCCMDILTKKDCIIVGLATIGIDYREETKDWIDNNFVTFVSDNI